MGCSLIPLGCVLCSPVVVYNRLVADKCVQRDQPVPCVGFERVYSSWQNSFMYCAVTAYTLYILTHNMGNLHVVDNHEDSRSAATHIKGFMLEGTSSLSSCARFMLVSRSHRHLNGNVAKTFNNYCCLLLFLFYYGKS